MTRILFIRHAETELAGRYCGHSDPDLSDRGRAQLTRLVRDLSGETFDHVYSSDLLRATRTAEAITGARDLRPLLRPALREIHFGEWEGMSWEEIERLDPDYAREWVSAYPRLPAPSGETFQAFEQRVLDEVNALIRHNRGPMVVVTHAGVLRVVLRHLCGYSEPEAWQETKSYCCVVPYEAKGESQ